MKHNRGNTGTIRRLFKHASICLLLGAIVNVVVAWGFAWFTPPIGSGGYTYTEKDDDYDGTISYICEKYFPSVMDQESFPYRLTSTYDYGELKYDLIILYSSTHDTFLNLELVRVGFPFNCLSYHYWTRISDENGVEFLEDKFTLLWKKPFKRKYGRIPALPLRPLWPAFAINTIFYGVIIWLLFIAPFLLRRGRRVSRGLCMKCGYNLRGDYKSGCPECGWNRDLVRGES